MNRKFSTCILYVCFVCMFVSCRWAESDQLTPSIQNIQPTENQTSPTSDEHLGEFQRRPMDDMRMTFIPHNVFQMGSSEAEIEAAIDLCQQHYSTCNRWYYERESPLHTVSLSSFWIDQTEVSNAQYRLCVEAGICAEPTICKKGEPTYSNPINATHPVVCVNWEEAQNYCQWVGARLPTEAEWEYAFRGENRSIFPWGDAFNGNRLNYCDQNCGQIHADEAFDDGYPQTAPIRSYPTGVSWSGVYNMGGNVSEWVSDWFGEFTAVSISDPSGPSAGTEKIIKGCSWFFHPTYCRGAARHAVDPDTRFDYLGFRCASDPQITSTVNFEDQITPSETVSPTAQPKFDDPEVPQPTATQKTIRNELNFVNAGNQFEPTRSWDVALGDLDGDGDLDALTSNDDPDGMKIWFNDGRGIFTQGDQVFDSTLRVAIGDLDRDSDFDIVATNWDPDADEWLNGHMDGSVWLNDGSGYFSKTQTGMGGDQIFDLDLMDVNGDGYLDIFFTEAHTNSVWWNDGNGSFYDSGQQLKTGIDAAVVFGDLEGDGDLDVLTGGWDGSAKVWLNDGLGNFAIKDPNMTGINLHIHGLSLADFDLDGDLDAFAALANGGPHEVWLNQGDGSFTVFQKLSAPLAQGVVSGDIDGDGDIDVVTAHGHQTGGHVRIWLNDGFGSFTDSQTRLGNTFSSDVALGDLDDDGDLDIFATHTDWHHRGHGEPDWVWLNQSAASKPLPDTTNVGDTYKRPTDGMSMFFVPTGSFQMGGSENDPDANTAEYPMHEVKLDSYWIDQTEVSNAQYNLCVASGICRESRYQNSAVYSADDYPAVGVAWNDALDYCEWAGGRLPTEAEWEYAAKGVNNSRYPWGDVFDGNKLNYCDRQCSESWSDPNYDDGYVESAPVGTFPEGASWIGALDMAGNVWEWTRDWCAGYSSDPQTNPTGPDNGTCKLIRGGAWASPATGVRTSFRMIGSAEISPDIRHPNIGFRCVVPVEQGSKTGVEIDVAAVPQGNPPIIDGTISPGEWDGAMVETFADGSEIQFTQDGEYLYLSIRANTPEMIAANIFLQQDDRINILHASAALGTASYLKGDQSWQQVKDFTWRCRSTSNSESAQAERVEFLQEEKWLAANGLMGTPNELEYQIKIPDQDFRLAAVYIKSSYPYEKVGWPNNLDDDCVEPSQGGLPSEMQFSPDQWGMIKPTDPEKN